MFGLPPTIFNVLWFLHNSPTASSDTYIDFIEFFSGVGVIHENMLKESWNSLAYDVINNPM